MIVLSAEGVVKCMTMTITGPWTARFVEVTKTETLKNLPAVFLNKQQSNY